MSETRNAYGFPLTVQSDPSIHSRSDAEAHRLWLVVESYRKPLPTQLERAHAIASEVRARKFTPVCRFNHPTNTDK